MKKIVQLLSVIALLSMFLINSASALAQEEVTVSVNAPSEVIVDSDITVTVDISYVVDFDAGQFDVSFDNSVLRLDNVSYGLIGATEIPYSFYVKVDSGVYRILLNVRGLPGISGSGYLAVLHFHVIGSAGSSSDIQLSGGCLNDNQSQDITATWIGDSVTACEELVINTAFLLDGVVGSAYSASLEATGGDENYNWSVSSGDLPDGVSLDSTGKISGIPTTRGTSSFIIEVTDGGLSESREYYMTVTSAGDTNQDNKVNTADITKLERIIIGLDDTSTGADVNKDGKINTADITRIEMVIVCLD